MIGNYLLRSVISTDATGETIDAEHRDTGERVTIKALDISNTAVIKSVSNEIDVFERLGKDGSEYILKYIDDIKEKYKGKNYRFIIMESLDASPLTSFITAGNGNIPPPMLWPIMLQLMLGLKYIHDRGFAHRSITSNNIYMTKNNRIKYTGFRTSCFDTFFGSTCKDTPDTTLTMYRPPEDFNTRKENSLSAEKAGDIWSLSMVFFELVHGNSRFPFVITDSNGARLSEAKIIDNIIRTPPSQSVYKFSSKDGNRTNSFLNSMIVRDWTKRPKINDLIAIFMDKVLSYTYNPN